MLDGAPPVSASATQAPGQAHSYRGKVDYDLARALPLAEIPRLIADYVRAAENARRAGFDGVQLHAANGYLIDQFLRDGTNLRDDDYGGSPENRCRLLKEALEALIGVWGAGHVSVRLSPNDSFMGCKDSNPDALFTTAAHVVQDLGVGFLELRHPGLDGSFGAAEDKLRAPMMRAIYKGPLVLNADYDAERADADVSAGLCDAVSFGRPYISNPDLAERIRNGEPFAANVGAPATWYAPGPVGYTDYPAMEPVTQPAN